MAILLRALAVLAVLAVLVGPVGAARAEEVIRDYVQTIEVGRDNVLEVSEQITVDAEGDRIRRGIYRDFPTTFIGDDGRRHRVGFEVTEVLRDGRPEPYTVSRSGEGARIYIGEEDVFLQPGTYTYTLSYRTTRQLRSFPDHDELYWNVTGNDWAFPIQRVIARVDLPEGVRATGAEAYTGAYGEQGQAYAVDGGAGSRSVTFRTTRPLAPGEGLTVVVAMPPGTVAPPTGLDRAVWFFEDYRETILVGLGLLGVLVYYLFAWSRVGRDPPKGTIIPLFEPPPGVSPALAQYIHERGLVGAGWEALSASWVALAVKGLVEIDAEDRELTIRATGARRPAGLASSERRLLDWVQARGGSATINRANGPAVKKLGSDYVAAVHEESRETFFRNNYLHAGLGIALSVAAIALAAVMAGNGPDSIPVLFPLVFAAVFGTVGVNGFAALRRRGLGRRIVGAVVGLFVLVFAAGATGASLMIAEAVGSSWTFPAAVVVLLAVNVLFFHLLAAPTVNGRKVMDKLEGLILYMTVAEEKRLNMPGLPPVTPSRYEALLPYAMALGVERPWSDALQGHLARAAATAGTAAASYSPRWYHGSGAFDRPSDLGRSLGAMSGTFQSSVPPPKSSSSGSGGGGRSGGGGGGGGGGGW